MVPLDSSTASSTKLAVDKPKERGYCHHEETFIAHSSLLQAADQNATLGLDEVTIALSLPISSKASSTIL